MKTFIVTGEYGIQEGQYEQRTYRALTGDNARKRFIREMKKEIGGLRFVYMRTNISVVEITK